MILSVSPGLYNKMLSKRVLSGNRFPAGNYAHKTLWDNLLPAVYRTFLVFLFVVILLTQTGIPCLSVNAEGSSLEVVFDAKTEIFTMDTIPVKAVLYFNNSSSESGDNTTGWNRSLVPDDTPVELEWSFDDDINHTTFQRTIYVFYREPGEHWVGIIARWNSSGSSQQGVNNGTVVSNYYKHYIQVAIYKEKGWKVAAALFVIAALLCSSIAIMVKAYFDGKDISGDKKKEKKAKS